MGARRTGAALDIGIAINHSTYDTMYLAFAMATGASAVVTAYGVRTHSQSSLAAMAMTLEDWAHSRNIWP